jgi:two-component system, OmpR family, alkaline phosphatase synthesis response regulator PhoP
MRDYRVLVVDSNPDVLALIAFQLKQARFDVYAAIDGTRGFYLAEKYIPDLVFIDCRSKGLSWVGLISAIKNNERLVQAKIILMSDDRWTRPDEAKKLTSFDLWIDKTQCATKFAEIALNVLESKRKQRGC